MTIEIKGTHGYAPGETTKEYINKKLKRLAYVEEHIADFHITLHKEPHSEYRVESNIHFRWGSMGHLKVVNRDLFKAIDLIFDKIEAKATKEKEKNLDHSSHGQTPSDVLFTP